MNKEEFLKELRNKLKGLPKDEIDNVSNYYFEYFQEAAIESDNVLEEVGKPSEIASQILAEYAFNSRNGQVEGDHGKKNIFTTIWFIILAIFAAPIGFPIASAILLILVAVIMTIIAGVFSIMAMGASFLFAGLMSIIAGFILLGVQFSTAMIFIGVGCMILGVGILCILILKIIIPIICGKCIKSIKEMISKINKKVKRGVEIEK